MVTVAFCAPLYLESITGYGENRDEAIQNARESIRRGGGIDVHFRPVEVGFTYTRTSVARSFVDDIEMDIFTCVPNPKSGGTMWKKEARTTRK